MNVEPRIFVLTEVPTKPPKPDIVASSFMKPLPSVTRTSTFEINDPESSHVRPLIVVNLGTFFVSIEALCSLDTQTNSILLIVAFFVARKKPALSKLSGTNPLIVITGRDSLLFSISPNNTPLNGVVPPIIQFAVVCEIGKLLITLNLPSGFALINAKSVSLAIGMKLSTASLLRSGKYFSSFSDQYLTTDQPEKTSWK